MAFERKNKVETVLIAKAFMYKDNLRVPMLVRWPGQTPAGTVNDSLQSLIGLAPTFLAASGLGIPGAMQGIDQRPSWTRGEKVRHNLIVEHRHQPSKFNIRTYVNQRYKLTIYRGHDRGELFDLADDSGELKNRRNDPAYRDVRAQLMFEAIQAEITREPIRMPRVAGA